MISQFSNFLIAVKIKNEDINEKYAVDSFPQNQFTACAVHGDHPQPWE